MEWTWSIDQDTWDKDTFNSKAETIRDAKDSGETEIYIGKCEIIPLRADVDVDRLMEELNESYCNETDSDSDTYLYEDVSEKDKKWLEIELNKLIHKFHKKTAIKSNWFKVIKIERVRM